MFTELYTTVEMETCLWTNIKHTKDLNHFTLFLCELYFLVIVEGKSAQTSRKIAYKTSRTFLSEKHVLYGVLPLPKSALKPRGMRSAPNKMERFVIRELEEIYNFLGKQTLKPEAAIYGSMTLLWELRESEFFLRVEFEAVN